ncbi:hypothetical protein PTI98_008107 [Pleurotus ostreatus]|nr:hypothetical protein PTI98_008107 [Pleurotus ostreatus]
MGGHALSFTRLLLSNFFYLSCFICLLSCCVQTCYRSPPAPHPRRSSPHLYQPHPFKIKRLKITPCTPTTPHISPRSDQQHFGLGQNQYTYTLWFSFSACPFYELSCAYLQL